jgi:hypothetical protein
MKLDRKEFMKLVLGMTGLGVGVGVVGTAACGSSGTPSNTGTAGNGGGGNACDTNAPTDTISANHGHTLTVSKADVTAGDLKTYSIQGTAAHDHMVTITSASFDTLKTGQSIMLTSTTGANHMHTVTVICA